MSRTFKTQPWKVKASHWHAGNTEAWHAHHHNRAVYENLIRDGEIVYETGVYIRKHSSYSEYCRYEKRYGREPKALHLLPHKPLDTPENAHEETIWFQRVRYEKNLFFANTGFEVHERVEFREPVQIRVEPEIICTIDQPLNAENNWGNLLPCTYYAREPLRVVYANDRRERKRRSVKFNRSISRAELHSIKKAHYAGNEIGDNYDATAHVVLKRNDWLG